jgi:hypothetical protein
VFGSGVVVAGGCESDRSALFDWPSFVAGAPADVEVGLDVCANAGTLPTIAPSNRIVSNFMTLSPCGDRIIADLTKLSQQFEFRDYKLVRVFGKFGSLSHMFSSNRHLGRKAAGVDAEIDERVDDDGASEHGHHG